MGVPNIYLLNLSAFSLSAITIIKYLAENKILSFMVAIILTDNPLPFLFSETSTNTAQKE